MEALAEPSWGWGFEAWTGDVPKAHETDNPLTLTMDGPKTLAARFVVTLTGGNGTQLGGGVRCSQASPTLQHNRIDTPYTFSAQAKNGDDQLTPLVAVGQHQTNRLGDVSRNG